MSGRHPWPPPRETREETKVVKVTRIPPEDPDVVRQRDGATLSGIGPGTDPIAYLGDEDGDA